MIATCPLTGQVLPNAKVGRQSHVKGVVNQPALKRRANETPLVPSWGQRKRFITPGHHSAAGIPAIPPPTPSSPHIKWTGIVYIVVNKLNHFPLFSDIFHIMVNKLQIIIYPSLSKDRRPQQNFKIHIFLQF